MQNYKTSSRIDQLDAARGVAVIFVFFAHAAWSYQQTTHLLVSDLLVKLGMVATPAFLLISGVILGYLWRVRPERFSSFRLALLDRGAFMLLVAHAIIAASQMSSALYSTAEVIGTTYATDAIAMSIIIVPWILVKLRGRGLFVLALALYAASTCLVLFWHPALPALEYAREILFGYSTDGAHRMFYTTPIVPCAAIYLAGCSAGTRLAERMRSAGVRPSRSWRWFTITGATCVLLGVGLHFALKPVLIHASYADFPLTSWVSFSMKTPPGPIYLMYYGGLALLLIGALGSLGERGQARRTIRVLQIYGRASLLMFLLQFTVNYIWIAQSRSVPEVCWPVILVLNAVLMWIAAHYWVRHDGNRLFTVGLRHRSSGRTPLPIASASIGSARGNFVAHGGSWSELGS